MKHWFRNRIRKRRRKLSKMPPPNGCHIYSIRVRRIRPTTSNKYGSLHAHSFSILSSPGYAAQCTKVHHVRWLPSLVSGLLTSLNGQVILQHQTIGTGHSREGARERTLSLCVLFLGLQGINLINQSINHQSINQSIMKECSEENHWFP